MKRGVSDGGKVISGSGVSGVGCDVKFIDGGRRGGSSFLSNGGAIVGGLNFGGEGIFNKRNSCESLDDDERELLVSDDELLFVTVLEAMLSFLSIDREFLGCAFMSLCECFVGCVCKGVSDTESKLDLLASGMSPFVSPRKANVLPLYRVGYFFCIEGVLLPINLV